MFSAAARRRISQAEETVRDVEAEADKAAAIVSQRAVMLLWLLPHSLSSISSNCVARAAHRVRHQSLRLRHAGLRTLETVVALAGSALSQLPLCVMAVFSYRSRTAQLYIIRASVSLGSLRTMSWMDLRSRTMRMQVNAADRAERQVGIEERHSEPLLVKTPASLAR